MTNQQTFEQWVTLCQNLDYRINPRTRDLNCMPGYERTDAGIDDARQQVLDACIDQAGSWAVMFNEPQFEL